MLCRQTTEVLARSRFPASQRQLKRLAQQLGGLFEGRFVRSILVFHQLPICGAALGNGPPVDGIHPLWPPTLGDPRSSAESVDSSHGRGLQPDAT
jgi:hypothetical protein